MHNGAFLDKVAKEPRDEMLSPVQKVQSLQQNLAEAQRREGAGGPLAKVGRGPACCSTCGRSVVRPVFFSLLIIVILTFKKQADSLRG
jgi:hypothetical protein